MKCTKCKNNIKWDDDYCSNCGHKTISKLIIRTILLVVIETAAFFAFANLSGNYVLPIIAVVYIACAITIEYITRIQDKSEKVIVNIVSLGIHVCLVMVLGTIDVKIKGEPSGALAILLVPLVMIMYVPILFVINFVVGLIFPIKHK